uniref:NADH-ubiquinone oxidoreductase chain 6 n=1 Tax=Aesalus sp. JL-2019 TaxID=2565995 RepID=A0A7L4VE16_9SCAR|nr:NADH dehydrogenase subunit 6 [Aesalus sp. JL-2019]
MFYLLMFLALFSVLLPMLNHPIPMGSILLFQTFLIASITGFLNMNFWYSYIIFIIMVGGLMVLFMYMTSVASNEKFKYSNPISLMMTMIMIMGTSYSIFSDYFSMHMKINYNDSLILWNSYPLSMSKFINYPLMLIYCLMIIYLFIILITVVKITNINKGPLRANP